MARPDKLPTTHGLSRSKIYATWSNLRNRCNNPNVRSYADYGKRGITYDKRWDKFENFYEDMKSGYRHNLTIDRIDNDRNYCKENCRWVDVKTQNRNTRRNRYITYAGKTMCVSEWAEYLGLKRSTFSARFYKYKWSLDRLIGDYL